MACVVAAAPISVSPVSVKLDAATEVGNLRVGNPGDTSAAVEVEVVRVKIQPGGQEQYEPASEFLITPPAFKLPPGETRLLRFRHTGKRTAMEGVYRIFVRQLPDRSGTGISFAVNIGVPVFVAPTTSQPALALLPLPQGAQLRNSGNVTVTVQQLEGAGCTEPVKVSARLFPQQTVMVPAVPANCALTAQSDKGSIPLTPDRP